MADIRVKFVSQKISKVRFRPTQGLYSQETAVFASGNWDDKNGRVCLWEIPQSDGNDNMDDAEYYTANEREPKQLCDVPHRGHVTDLEFISPEALIASSTKGSVTLYRCQKNSQDQTLVPVLQWIDIHSDVGGTSCACTCVASEGEDMFVTGGEDGRLNVFNVGQRRDPVRIIDNASSCSINGVSFLKQLEVIAIDSSGQLKIFDLRDTSDVPARTFSISGEQTALHCVARHPTQHHIVATGGQDGVLSVWDLRQDKFPFTLLEAHSAAMWEVKFHSTNPDHLFSCSEDGSLWHWDSSAVATLVTGTGAGSGGGSLFSQNIPNGGASNPAATSPWLGLDSGRSKMDITTLLPNQNLPVNSLDVEGETLICGTDEEAIYTIDIPGLR